MTTPAGTTMIIDAHTHVTGPATAAAARRFPTAPVFTAPPQQLIAVMHAAGVGQAVVIQPSLYGFDHTELVRCLTANPSRFVGIALADPGDPSFADEIERLVDDAPIRGIRVAPLIDPDLPWFETEAEPLYEAAARLDLSVNLLVSPAALPVVNGWVARHPELTIVIDHMGRPDLAPDRSSNLSRHLLRLAQFENVYVKVSALPEVSSTAYPHTDVAPWVNRTVAEFGAARVMWGSDFPFTFDAQGYQRSRTVLDGCRLTEAERAQILYATAATVYKVPAMIEGSIT
jgi:predicted TIM-barrel fold metal-dependent hydrolase